MADRLDNTEAVVDTIGHVVRLLERINKLQTALSDSLDVAASLAGVGGVHMDYATFYDIATMLKECEVPGRSVFTGGRALAPPPGTVIRRDRTATEPAWPGSAPCVYILLNDTRVIYVGKSGNVGSRIAGHSAKPWTTVEIIICESDQAATELEGDLIFQHQPELNRAGRWERPRAGTGDGYVDYEDFEQERPRVDTFKAEWNRWLFDGQPAPLPDARSLDKSIDGWVFGGKVNLAELIDLIPVALDRDGVAFEDRFRYFCGVAWRHIKEGGR